ncbi:BZ3501_MvSof-1269-A2-R1_Chr9g10404 [Microbotryum saponariae]|nr:BZ3501_MvSof-1269-A2-R1_Chr9g10404 [Microbotryum saponariae]
MFRYQVRLVQRIYRSLRATLRFDYSSTEPTWSVWSKIPMDAVFQVSRATNKVDSYQEIPNTRYKHQTARVAGLVLPRRLRTRSRKKKDGHESCSADHMTTSYDLGLISIGIGIDRHPSLHFFHGHPRYLDIPSIFNLGLIPPFRMCSDGYERNTTVLKKGGSRLVGSSDWPRRIRDLS